MTKNLLMDSVDGEEGKKRLLEKYGRREIHLANDNQPLRGIRILHEMGLGLTVKEMHDMFKHLPSVEIDGFKYRIMP